MAVTTISYLLFVTLGAVIYYLLPKKAQWVWLLLLSVCFYCLAATPYTLLYVCVSVLTAYLATNLPLWTNKPQSPLATAAAVLAIVCSLLLWFLLKAYPIWGFLPGLRPLPLAVSLGMGYYTLQITGYVLDCRWGTAKPQKNPAKLLLFTLFFPQMITGPISRYSQLSSIYDGRSFSYERFTRGAQRILWGFFKKLVIAERVALIVDGIYGNIHPGMGVLSALAVLLYPIQMYADFSGCMDIVLGVGELFGIVLPENFHNPFFSRSSREFWQRWHITLGLWAKDYVLYPLMKSAPILSLGRKAKARFGKRLGKFIPTAICSLALWLVIGLWHGDWKYVLGVGLWYWLIVMTGDLLQPLFRRTNAALKIRESSTAWHLFQSARTYVIYAVGAVFFRADGLREALRLFRCGFSGLTAHGESLRALLHEAWDASSLTKLDLGVLALGVLLLAVVGVLREKHGYARNWMEKRKLCFRWLVWLLLLALVLIFGMYGPRYNAADFIYAGF